ncbi:MAG: glutathione S-transferase family protein [Rhodospirillales bacterium]|nr:glutathione S-transferase family protein [Rhodospirillales bacterium]
MRTLYHLWLSAPARAVRIALVEKRVEAELVLEKPWERRPDFLALNPACEVPVLVEPDGTALADAIAICEYLDETHPEPPLLGHDPLVRAEARRLVGWFANAFNREVTETLVGEKVMKRHMGGGGPDSRLLRIGYSSVHAHLEYIGWLTERRRWLAGEAFSLADIMAAAHLSTIDYLGDVPWDDHPPAKDWYARVKSRPSFRPLLADHVPGLPPPRHYADLDF